MNKSTNYSSQAVDPDILSVLDVASAGKVVTAEVWKKLWNLVLTKINYIDEYCTTLDGMSNALDAAIEDIGTQLSTAMDAYDALKDGFVHYGTNAPTNPNTVFWVEPGAVGPDAVEDDNMLATLGDLRRNYKSYVSVRQGNDVLLIWRRMQPGRYLLKAGSHIWWVNSTVEDISKDDPSFALINPTTTKLCTIYTDTEVLVTPYISTGGVPNAFVNDSREIHISAGISRETNTLNHLTPESIYTYSWEGTPYSYTQSGEPDKYSCTATLIKQSNAITVDQSFDEDSSNPQSGKAVAQALSGKQATLVSGQNIKTINGESILGYGDLEISIPEGGSGENGATFIPSVSTEGVISWTNDKGLSNPTPVNIKGDKGDKGDPYILTESDIAKIVATVIESIGTPVFGTIDENNNIIITGDLTDGTYVFKYEGADGTYTDIGSLVVGGVVQYSITPTITNCTTASSNATVINEGGTVTLKYVAKDGFVLPETITVNGASYTWDSATGTLVLSNPTADVTISITAIVYVAYTNVLPLAQEYASTSPYVGSDGSKGYGNDMRISSSSPSTTYMKAATGVDATALIPVKRGDIIRLKNCNLKVSPSNATYGTQIVGFDSSKAVMSSFTVTPSQIANRLSYVVENDEIVQFTLEPLAGWTTSNVDNLAYIMISTDGLDETSIITINEEITD